MAERPTHADPKDEVATLSHTPSIELVFSPSVALISIVRRFVSDFYARLVDDPDVAGRLALATHELLENAAKYTSGGETYLHVDLDRRTGVVTVRTRNRTDRLRIETLKRSFDELARSPDPAALYAVMMRRTAHEAQGSGLGLVRIRTEGEMELDLQVTDDLVEINARGLVSMGAQS